MNLKAAYLPHLVMIQNTVKLRF